MTGGFVDVWINCPDRETAGRIAEACLERRLAACANILAPVSAVYRWKGAIEREEELPLVLKCRANTFSAVCAEVRKRHPYEVPSIVAIPMTTIDPGYEEWLEAETREQA